MNVIPFQNTGPLCAEHHGGHCPDPETCVYRLTGAPTASIRQAHHHALEAYRLLDLDDQHYAECECNRCCAVGELSAALIELKQLAKATP